MSTEEQPPPSFTAPSPEEVAKHFPAYEEFTFIAQGGMGAVYRALQTSLDREVVIKILPKEIAVSDEFKEQFQAEAKAMAKLNHPNLIAIYDFGTIDDFLFISMEYVNGKSLYYSCYEKKIEQVQAAEIVMGICDGLHHAHQSGIIHRDIKPANILLDQKARPKIGDFGLACGIENGGEGIIYGTPGYAAPEVTNDPASIDERSDIYATGVILHELLTAEMPTEPLTPATKLCKCHPAFNTIIRKALHRNPAMRFKTAEQLSQEISKAVASVNNVGGSGGKAPLSPALKTNSAGGVKRPPVSSAPPPKSGGAVALLRNILIIAALGGAVFAVKNMIAAKEKENAAIELASKNESERIKAEQKKLNEERHALKMAKQREAEEKKEALASSQNQPREIVTKEPEAEPEVPEEEPEESSGPPPEELLNLQKIARTKLAEIAEKRSELVQANGDNLKSRIKSTLGSLNRSDLIRYEADLKYLQDIVKANGVIPTNKVPKDLEDKIEDLLKPYLEKQSKYQNDLEKATAFLHTAYLKKLVSVHKDLKGSNPEGAQHLEKEHKRQANLRAFFNRYSAKNQRYNVLFKP